MRQKFLAAGLAVGMIAGHAGVGQAQAPEPVQTQPPPRERRAPLRL